MFDTLCIITNILKKLSIEVYLLVVITEINEMIIDINMEFYIFISFCIKHIHML